MKIYHFFIFFYSYFYLLKDDKLHPIITDTKKFVKRINEVFDRYTGEIVTSVGAPTGMSLTILTEGTVMAIRNFSALATTSKDTVSEYLLFEYEKPTLELAHKLRTGELTYVDEVVNIFNLIPGHFCMQSLRSPGPIREE